MEFREVNYREYNLYASEVADIHLESYSNKHMTALFSKKKLKEYYRFLVEESELFVIAFKDGEESVSDQVLGFIVAGPNVSKGVARFLKANQHYLLWLMLKNPLFLCQKAIAIARSKLLRSKPSNANFRLLSIAVKAGKQSLGIGGGMLQFFEKILKEKGISMYGLSVRKKNHRAVLFYQKNGFILEKEISGSKYYIKEIL